LDQRTTEFRKYTPLLLIAGVMLLIFLAWGAAIFILNSQNLRCYKITHPLTRAEYNILSGKSFECAETVCRTKFRLGANGIACFFTPHTFSLIVSEHKTSTHYLPSTSTVRWTNIIRPFGVSHTVTDTMRDMPYSVCESYM